MRRDATAMRMLLNVPCPNQPEVPLHFHLLKLLKDLRRPATTTELATLLGQRGVPLKGKKPTTHIYIALKRHPEMFRKVDRTQWRAG